MENKYNVPPTPSPSSVCSNFSMLSINGEEVDAEKVLMKFSLN